MEISKPSGPGPWVDQHHAYAAIAAACSAEQARSFKKARESHDAAAEGLTWDQFCKERFGLSRARVDHCIHILGKFGQPFFQLAQITHISARTFKRLHLDTRIADNIVQFDGRNIEIAPENAPQLRAAVQSLRDRQRKLEPAAHAVPSPQPAPPPPPAAPLPSPAPDPPTKAEVLAILDQFYDAADLGNKPAWLAHLAPNAVFVGPRRKDRLLLASLHFTSWPYNPTNRSVTFSPDGNTAWFDEYIPDGDGLPQCTSGVLIRLEGLWKIAQLQLAVLRSK